MILKLTPLRLRILALLDADIPRERKELKAASTIPKSTLTENLEWLVTMNFARKVVKLHPRGRPAVCYCVTAHGMALLR